MYDPLIDYWDQDPNWTRELPHRLTKHDDLPRWSWNRNELVKLNKFYVGAAHIGAAISMGTNAEWSKPTFEAAVKHGKEIMETDNKDCVVIVQIVAVLTREPNPIRVKKV